MKKQNAGERKRTVTITLGPLHEQAAREFAEHMTRPDAPLPWNLTDVVMCMVHRGLQEARDNNQIKTLVPASEWLA